MRRVLVVAMLALVWPCFAGAQGTPGETPQVGQKPSADQLKQETKVSRPSEPSPEPVMVKREAFFVAGARYEGEAKQGEIPALWDKEFLPRLGELEPLRAGEGLYGITRALPGIAPGPFEYLACLPVKSVENLPAGIVGWRIAAHTYAVFPAKGVGDLRVVLDYIYGTWLPKSPYRDAGDITVEWYPPSFPKRDIIYIQLPVEPKQQPKEGAAAAPLTIYNPEPTIIARGEIRLVGCEDLIIDGLTAKTKQPIPSLYQAAAERIGKVKHITNPMIMVGDNRADNPADVWAGGPGYHQLAGFEVSAFENVPQEMTLRLLPPSKYAVFTCDAPTDPKTGAILGQAEWGPVYPYYAFNRARWGFKDKDYYLEFFHHAAVDGGYPIVHYELWIPIE